MEHSTIQNFFGVPVLVQLRFPIAGITVKDRGRLPYALNPDASQWVPEAMLDNGSPTGTQLVQCAVLRQLEEKSTMVEMVWAAIPAPPAPGEIMGRSATIATVIDSKDIVAITRVVDMPDLSRLVLPSAK